MTTILAEIFRHHLWANVGMIDACAALDDAQRGAAATGTYGAIGDTLLHLASAESRFIAAVTSDHTGVSV
ncbi:MAG: DinB family protein, partial [Tepidiformaceae bacterium]